MLLVGEFRQQRTKCFKTKRDFTSPLNLKILDIHITSLIPSTFNSSIVNAKLTIHTRIQYIFVMCILVIMLVIMLWIILCLPQILIFMTCYKNIIFLFCKSQISIKILNSLKFKRFIRRYWSLQCDLFLNFKNVFLNLKFSQEINYNLKQ